MDTARFSDLQDVDDLARAAGVSGDDILAYVKATPQKDHYVELQIPKRGRKRKGQFRVVYAARAESLSQLHRGVAMLVVASTRFPECVQGFVQKRSILTNAQQHLAAREVLHGDIRGFFDAITIAQVESAFVSLGATQTMATLLSRACTIDGFLRQGTRCSPVIANLVCRQLDVELSTLANAYRATYTRYADDMTFSGDRTPSSDEVMAVIQKHGFELRDGRCYLQRRRRGQYVTGLTVVDATQPRLPSRLKRRLRLVLHCVEKFGRDEHFAHAARRPVVRDHQELEGMLRFVHSIEPNLALKLRKQFRVGSAKSRAVKEEIEAYERQAYESQMDSGPEGTTGAEAATETKATTETEAKATSETTAKATTETTETEASVETDPGAKDPLK